MSGSLILYAFESFIVFASLIILLLQVNLVCLMVKLLPYTSWYCCSNLAKLWTTLLMNLLLPSFWTTSLGRRPKWPWWKGVLFRIVCCPSRGVTIQGLVEESGEW